MSNLLSIFDFKENAKKGTLKEDSFVEKTFFAEKQIDKDARTIDFVISTNGIDRDNDRIEVEGWDIDNYLKNPVVLWAHDSGSLPVGKSVRTILENGKLRSTAKFCEKDYHPFADTVFQLYLGGFLNAVSVGFKPKEYTFAEDEERPYGMNFLKQELLEYSCVPIPSNPEALIQARSKGIDTSPLYTWAENLLDINNCLLVPKSVLEQVREHSRVVKRGTMPVKSIEVPYSEDDKATDNPKQKEFVENNDPENQEVNEKSIIAEMQKTILELSKKIDDLSVSKTTESSEVELDFSVEELEKSINEMVASEISHFTGHVS